MGEKRKSLETALFLAYCGLMLWLLLNRSRAVTGIPYWEQVAHHYNLRPFHTVALYARLLGSSSCALVKVAAINLAGNVVMFVPLGYFLPRLFRGLGKLWRTLLVCAGIVATVELIQLFALVGSCDVDDLILNLIGAALGYGLFKRIK